MNENDNIIITRSFGIPTEGIPDQYADGKAARVWKLYIGDTKDRTKNYRDFLVNQLRNRNCQNIMDLACGTGVDSVMLVEEGFNVVSVDASDKMLKYALKERWQRRKDPRFDQWVIEEGNWLTLLKDVQHVKPKDGFDALICLGNSFPHLYDNDGKKTNIKKAIRNFFEVLKPGGYLIVDHRNNELAISGGYTKPTNIYYTSKYITKIITSVLYIENEPKIVSLDYKMDTSQIQDEEGEFLPGESEFRLSYYPHKVNEFSSTLKEIFGSEAEYELYGDFKPIEEFYKNNSQPLFYNHVIRKPF